MGTRNVSQLQNHGAPSWVRGVCVTALAFFLIGDLILASFSWASRGGARSYEILALLGILALVAFVLLVRAWKSYVSPSQ
jgi:hypothetical protein